MVGVIVVAILGSMISSHTSLERSIDIDTPAAPIYDILITTGMNAQWMPVRQKGGDVEYSFEGHHKGEGATMIWKSDDSKIGSGRIELTQCIHNKSVRALVLRQGQKPVHTEFILDEFEGYTEVTWLYDMNYGMNPFMHYLTLFTEQMIGPTYEEGLLNLKTLVEATHIHEDELDIELEGDHLVDSLKHLQE